MTAAARLVLVAALATVPGAAGAAAGARIEGAVRYTITVGEDRVWITEVLDLRPTGGEAVALPERARGLAPPPGAGDGVRGGLRVGAGPFVETDLVDGAVELPDEAPPDGVSAAIDYSLPASDEAFEFVRRYAVPVGDVRVAVTAGFPGMTVSLSGAPAVRAEAAPQGNAWSAAARRTAPLAAGAPLTIAISDMPAYRLPIYAKAALGLAAVIVLCGAFAAFGRTRRGARPPRRQRECQRKGGAGE